MIVSLCASACVRQVTGAAGLVHKSELSWGEVTVTSSVVQPGMEVEVKVMSIDEAKGHISLSMKQCQVRCPLPPPPFLCTKTGKAYVESVYGSRGSLEIMLTQRQ